MPCSISKRDRPSICRSRDNNANSAALGDFAGTLHLRAPQIADNTDLQLNPINGQVIGASSIVVEGYELFDLTATGGAINSTVQGAVRANATAFHRRRGTTTPTLHRHAESLVCRKSESSDRFR